MDKVKGNGENGKAGADYILKKEELKKVNVNKKPAPGTNDIFN